MKDTIKIEEPTRTVISASGPECSGICDVLRALFLLVDSNDEAELTIKSHGQNNFEIIIARKEKDNET